MCIWYTNGGSGIGADTPVLLFFGNVSVSGIFFGVGTQNCIHIMFLGSDKPEFSGFRFFTYKKVDENSSAVRWKSGKAG